MKYKLVIFDLDGTVLDTIEDLANATNHALAQRGFPTHSVDQVRAMVGNGVANLIRKASPRDTDDAVLAAVLADFKAYYRGHINVCTKPYAGIKEMLAALKKAGVKLGINSNKFDAALQQLCHIHFEGLYDCAAGECETNPKKPDPTAALRIAQEMGVDPSQAIYIGDSGVDLDTAQNAGMDAAWVSWGFRREEEMGDYAIPMAFHSVSELQDFLLG